MYMYWVKFSYHGKTAVTWLKYCRYGVKFHPINQSIMARHNVHMHFCKNEPRFMLHASKYFSFELYSNADDKNSYKKMFISHAEGYSALSKIVCIYYNSFKKTFHLVNIFQMHIAKSGQQILTVNAQ